MIGTDINQRDPPIEWVLDIQDTGGYWELKALERVTLGFELSWSLPVYYAVPRLIKGIF